MVQLILVVLCMSFVITKGANIQFSLRGVVIPNHGLVSFEDITVDPNGDDLNSGLACMLISCCQDGEMNDNCPCPSANNDWDWYHSDGAVVRSFIGNDGYGARREGSAVYLFRRRNITRIQGIWRCRIPGEMEDGYVGIYPHGVDGNVTSTQNYIDVNANTLTQPILTLRTTGGPASSVTWRRNDMEIVTMTGSTFSATQDVTSTTNADYINTLTVDGKLSGVYEVSISNNRLETPVVRNTTIILDPSPTSLEIDRTGLTSIHVSWSQPEVTRFLIGYSLSVSYSTCPNEMCTDEGITDIIELNTLQRTLDFPDVPLWSSYSFMIDSEYTDITEEGFISQDRNPLRSDFILTGVSTPSDVSTPEAADPTSVTVTWTYPDDGLSVDDYMVSYQRTSGRGEQCSTYQHEGMQSHDGNSNSATVTDLEEFSVYSVTITARNNMYNLQNTSSPHTFTTPPAAPTGPPLNLTITNMTTTSITITWESVECIHRNGIITHYIISYRANNDHTATTITLSNDSNVSGTFTVTVNTCSTVSYSFEVAAVNSDGMGPSAVVQTSASLNFNQSSGIDYRTAFFGVLTTLILVVVVLVIIVVLFGITLRRHGLCQSSDNVPERSTIRLGANKAERDIKLNENDAYGCTQQGGGDRAYEECNMYEPV